MEQFFIDEFVGIPTVDLTPIDCEPPVRLNVCGGTTYHISATMREIDRIKLVVKFKCEQKIQDWFDRHKRL